MSLCCLICSFSFHASTHSDRKKQNKNTTDMYTGLLTNHSHICIHVFCTFRVLKVNSPSSCLHKTDGASSLIPKFSVFFFLKSPSVDFSEKLAMRTQSWSPSETLAALLTQAVDGGTDLESGTQLDIHCGDEMVLTQKQQRLPVYFLRLKLGSQLLTTLK